MRLILAVVISAAVIGPCSAAIDATRYVSQGLTTSQPAYQLGEKATFSYAIRNDGSTPASFTFPTAKQFDIWIMIGDQEVYRLSAGRAYARSTAVLNLQPGEAKTFCAEWDQTDLKGKQVGPGVYTAYARLTPKGKAPPATMTKVQIGLGQAAMVPMTICQVITDAVQTVGRKVMIDGTYRGSSPPPNDPNTKAGPPVDKSDWALCDGTGCMYVHGAVKLNPTRDIGTTITVVGTIAQTDKGQVYMNLESATTARGSVCPPGGG